MRRISKRDLLRRLDAVERRLNEAPPAPLPGQQAIPVATIRDHRYEGASGPCTAELFTVPCGQHRDAHQHTQEG